MSSNFKIKAIKVIVVSACILGVISYFMGETSLAGYFALVTVAAVLKADNIRVKTAKQ